MTTDHKAQVEAAREECKRRTDEFAKAVLVNRGEVRTSFREYDEHHARMAAREAIDSLAALASAPPAPPELTDALRAPDDARAEPTDEMLDAGMEALKDSHNVGQWGECGGFSWGDAKACWHAMRSAAPEDAIPPERKPCVLCAGLDPWPNPGDPAIEDALRAPDRASAP